MTMNDEIRRRAGRHRGSTEVPTPELAERASASIRAAVAARRGRTTPGDPSSDGVELLARAGDDAELLAKLRAHLGPEQHKPDTVAGALPGGAHRTEAGALAVDTNAILRRRGRSADRWYER
jgi:hypothetical protein